MITRFEIDFSNRLLNEMSEIRKALQKIANAVSTEKQLAGGNEETHREVKNECD